MGRSLRWIAALLKGLSVAPGQCVAGPRLNLPFRRERGRWLHAVGCACASVVDWCVGFKELSAIMVVARVGARFFWLFFCFCGNFLYLLGAFCYDVGMCRYEVTVDDFY